MADVDTPVDLTFRAMGSACRILVQGGSADLAPLLRLRLEALEESWSRFRNTSEISALNRAEGAPVIVGPDTVRLIEKAVDAWRVTDGWFDPLMLDSLVELGYDRDHLDLTLLPADARDRTPSREYKPARHSSMNELYVDVELGLVVLPPLTRFDPGGIGKGFAADLLVDMAIDAGVDGVLVDVGGDLRVGGDWFGGPVWPAVVAHPVERDRDLAELRIAGGALATSSSLRRRWWHGDRVVHHLLDPTTGAPCQSEIVSATVHAGAAWFAEALAKACLLAGLDAGPDLIRRSNTTALLFTATGEVLTVGDLEITKLAP